MGPFVPSLPLFLFSHSLFIPFHAFIFLFVQYLQYCAQLCTEWGRSRCVAWVDSPLGATGSVCEGRGTLFWGVGFVGGWDLPYIPSLERHAPESPAPYRQTHRKHPCIVVIVHFLFEKAAGKLTFNKTEKSERGMQSQWLLRPRKSHVSSSGQSDLSSCQSSL